MNYDCGFKVGSNPKWAVMPVNRILSNEIYTGMMLQGINSKINYKIREQTRSKHYSPKRRRLFLTPDQYRKIGTGRVGDRTD